MRALLVTVAAVVATLVPAAGHAVQVEPATSHPAHVRVSYLEPMTRGRVWLELNNGAAYRLKPCEWEDSRGCYWDAGTSGNGHGHSFVTVRVAGRACTLYVSRRYARRHDWCEVMR